MIDCTGGAPPLAARSDGDADDLPDMTISDLDTPALLIDLDRMEANLDRAAEYAHAHGLKLRPHTKTHKSPIIGQMQLDRGAWGLTVAKVGEAEVMASGAVPDLLIAYPVWGDQKWARLTSVARRVPVTVSLDSVEVAEGLQRHALRASVEIAVLVETDLGMRRCGLAPGPQLVGLARKIDSMKSLRLDGLMFYPGHVNPATDRGAKAMDQLGQDLSGILDTFRRDGLPTDTVSGGSTPTLYDSHRILGLTEIRPGTYVFNDRSQVAAGACSWEDCAASILVTVVSTPRADSAIIDGGSKTFTSDSLRPFGGDGYGQVLGHPGIRFPRMSEEHGVLDLSNHRGRGLKIGQRLRVVPNHVCVAVNMHEWVHGIRGETVERSWPVEGRGKLQ